MMVKKYNINVCISSIYYWIHHGKLGKDVKQFYPHKRSKKHKVASDNYKTFGKSIYEIKSITSDNGSEFSRLSEVFDKDMIFYTHP